MVPTANAKILIVDDNPTNIQLLQAYLSRDSYTNVHAIQDPTTVEAYLLGHQPDLILLDLNMPGLDGYGVLKLLRDKFSHLHIPVIVVTAQSDAASKMRALTLGAKDFLSKPLDRSETLTRVRNILEHQLLLVSTERLVAQRTQELLKTSEKLRAAHRDTLTRLAQAAEYRDNETGHHLARMSRYSCVIAKHKGYSPEALDYLLYAAPMHDIGKIAIPDGILLKPGKLTPEEFDIMKTHAALGAKLLENSESSIIQMAQIIALTHHEKWDGSGYPNKLREHQIPEIGRIVAIADCFDALTSKRPYKEAWPVQEALDYLKDQAGKAFDPELINLFCLNIHEILEIKKTFHD